MTGVGVPSRPSGVARLLMRRARLVAGLSVVPAAVALGLVPRPPDYDLIWALDLVPRAPSLAPDVLAGAAALLAVLTVIASIGLGASAWLRFAVVALTAAVVVALFLSTDGLSGVVGPCVTGPCPALFGDAGSSVAVWLAVLATGVTTWVAAGLFRGARPRE